MNLSTSHAVSLVAIVGAMLIAAPLAASAQAAASTAPKASTAKPTSLARKVATKPVAKPVEAEEPLSEAQLQVASRVHTGTAKCEFNQSVNVSALQDKPGHFKVAFNKAAYTMTPQETTTGAVRLEDKKSGVVWLQIPMKSMMMNQKIGQRMVDGCMGTEQQAAHDAFQASAK